VIFVPKFEMVLVVSLFLNTKDIKLPILASGILDTKKNFLTTIFTWHPESVNP